jgi:hypothetical protein
VTRCNEKCNVFRMSHFKSRVKEELLGVLKPSPGTFLYREQRSSLETQLTLNSHCNNTTQRHNTSTPFALFLAKRPATNGQVIAHNGRLTLKPQRSFPSVAGDRFPIRRHFGSELEFFARFWLSFLRAWPLHQHAPFSLEQHLTRRHTLNTSSIVHTLKDSGDRRTVRAL